jgi:hypothetical protein
MKFSKDPPPSFLEVFQQCNNFANRFIKQDQNSQSPLILALTRFLQSEKPDIQPLISLIRVSPRSQIAQAFSHLSSYLLANPDSPVEPSALPIAFEMSKKLSLQSLITNFVGSDLHVHAPNLVHNPPYSDLFKRASRLRGFLRSFFTNFVLSGRPQVFDFPLRLSDVAADLQIETSPEFQTALSLHFRRLLIDRASISTFRRLFERVNVKPILTHSIIDLLRELHESRDSSQSQLLFSFSSLFLYIRSFAITGEIDGHELVQWLHSRPFLSPFCLFAMSNHISSHQYLYSLLIPSELTNKSGNRDHAISLIEKLFPIFEHGVPDSSIDLTGVVEALPGLLQSYFVTTEKLNQPLNSSDEGSLIVHFHQCGSSLSEQLKGILQIVEETPFSPLIVSSLSATFINAEISAFLKIARDPKQPTFTPSVCSFFTLLGSIGFRLSTNLTVTQLFDVTSPPFVSERVLKTLACYGQFLLRSQTAQAWILPYALNVMQISEIHAVLGRFLIGRILSYSPVRLTTQLLDSIDNCRDVGVCLDFLWFSTMHSVYIYEEVPRITTFREALIDRLPFTFEGLEITGINPLKLNDFSDISREIVDAVGTFIARRDRHEITRGIKAATWVEVNRQLLLLRILCQTRRFGTDLRFRESLSESISLLAAHSAALAVVPEAEQPDLWEFRVKDSVLPLAHFFLDRIIATKTEPPTETGKPRSFRESKDGDMLVKMWYSLLVNDPLVVPWIARFVRSHFDRLTERWRSELLDLFLRNGEQHNITEILEIMVEVEHEPVREAESLLTPYTSRHEQIMEAGLCSVLLSGKSANEIIGEFTTSVFQGKWNDRLEIGRFVSQIVATLPQLFAIQYFEIIVNHPGFPGAAVFGSVFLSKAHIEVLVEICRMADKLIDRSPIKLDLLIEVMMPNIMRLSGCVDAGRDLVIAWIGVLALPISKELRSKLMDSIEAVYSLLDLRPVSHQVVSAILEKVPESCQTTILIRLELDA